MNDDRNYRLFDELLPLHENLSALVIPKLEIAPHLASANPYGYFSYNPGAAFFYCLETFEQEKGDLKLTLEGFAFASRRSPQGQDWRHPVHHGRRKQQPGKSRKGIPARLCGRFHG